MFVLKEIPVAILTVFLVALLGYALGRIHIKGMSLGTAAIFLAGLLFGHFGAQVPPIL